MAITNPQVNGNNNTHAHSQFLMAHLSAVILVKYTFRNCVPVFLQAGYPSYHPTNSIKALKDECNIMLIVFWTTFMRPIENISIAAAAATTANTTITIGLNWPTFQRYSRFGYVSLGTAIAGFIRPHNIPLTIQQLHSAEGKQQQLQWWKHLTTYSNILMPFHRDMQ